MKIQLVSSLLAALLLLTACMPVVRPTADTNTPAPVEEAAVPAATVTTPIATPVAPAAAIGLGDSYFPLQGNPGYDAQHYTIALAAASSDLMTIAGTTTIDALATAELPSFNLDFLGLDISAITVNGADATFSRDGQELTVTPATPIAAGAPFSVSVAYAGRPVAYADPALAIYQKGVFKTS